MYYRICDHSQFYADSDENDIYRKFKYQFDNLFNADELPKTDREFKEMYVHDEEFERNLKNFLQLFSNSAKFCVGYTGIGKTTSIRYCLNLGVSTVAKLDTRSFRSPTHCMVIFPTFLDGALSTDGGSFDLKGRIAAVCTSMEEKHPELRKVTRTNEGREKLYKFIREHTPRILEPENDYTYDEESIHNEIKQRLRYAQDNHPFEYYANKLKHYIGLTKSTYDRLVIVLDDIETLSDKQQHEVISNYLHLYGCMNNTKVDEDEEYRITMLISVRPHTLRLYRKKESIEKVRGFESFTILNNTVLKKNAVDLSVFFKKRFDYYTSRSPKAVGNKDSWDKCYKSLMKLNDAFDGKYKSMISNLCFLNVRASLAVYSSVFANRFWIQGNHARAISFDINPSEYSFNNINVIRAIGCGNSAVFTGSSNSIIPNIFLTSENSDYSILCLLVMKYFIATVVDDNDFYELSYGEEAKALNVVLHEWESAVGGERTKLLHKALEYLFEQKVLRKSIEDTDDFTTMDKSESLDSNSKLYLSPRGYEAMQMLSRDSVLFEMLRECSWRDYSDRESFYNREPSYTLMLQKNQDLIFLDLLEYIDYLREQEENFFFDSKEDIDLQEYRDIFGSTLVVNCLLDGVMRSLTYSGHIANPIIKSKLIAVQEHISESTRLLQDDM